MAWEKELVIFCRQPFAAKRGARAGQAERVAVMKKEVPSLLKLAEGIEDPSFQRFYGFFFGRGSLLIIYIPYLLMLIVPRHFFDFQGPRSIMTWLPKFWFEARNFKAKYLIEDINFYFSTSLLSYAVMSVISIVAAIKCYRTGRNFPFTLTQSQPWKPYRFFLIPALIAILLGVVVPLPVGGDDSGFRGNPFENPVYLPAYSSMFFGLLMVVSAAGALWLGRERARLRLERQKPPRPMVSVFLDQREHSDS
ncbi:hypothetical protein PZN02_002942 [Sinorhizobium garamanticum]|uniref:Uncharacterized protein n=1 Tax=Sinorhizobium garamanticum TaxID=680247 RepID=A0ABY8D6Y6_9HYPH|nr:hypothetical protein [Sinorhizobium garamanticum]WEX86639.1 hypothetical protein PZN02_002942 [Sinorhizobium garamanticum]